MVHALDEIRRVLKPGGIMLDIRPLETCWPVEMAWSDGIRELGQLAQVPEEIEDDEACERALAEAAMRGWFQKEEEEIFSFFYYWDNPAEMKEFLDSKWPNPPKMSAQEYAEVLRAWAGAKPGARMRVRLSVLMARWRTLTRPSQMRPAE
jgi:hypothetical protein